MFSKIKAFFSTRRFETCELVYNMEKKCTQIVLSEVPYEKKENFGLQKFERAYICSERGSNNWTVEYAKNLRQATVFEK